MALIHDDLSLIGSKVEFEKDKLSKYLKKDNKGPPEPAFVFG
jgi:hypothetical protein